VYVIVKSIFVTVFRPKGASEARARGLLMVKTMNKYTLNSLVSDLFCDDNACNFARRPNQEVRYCFTYATLDC